MRPALVLPALIAFAAAPQDVPPLPADYLPANFGTELPLGLPDKITPALVGTEAAALGRTLFFDPILSADRSVACASCHEPSHGFASPSALSLGVHGRRTLRNAPTLYNKVLGESFMWDGRAETLEEQVLQPIENELEMDLALDEAVARLSADTGYAAAFEGAFGAAPSTELLAKALAAFVKRIVYGDSAIDRFRTGEVAALTPAARAGLWFYESRGGCWRCHSGPNFTDEDFHATGVGARDGVPEEGRFAVTGRAEDLGRFKTPTLRGLAETGPYMHDGSLASLADVVEFYRKGGRANANLDPVLEPLEMSDADAVNLVAFLRALSRP